MCEKIIAEAPGKVILFGEHAVCFGKRAIATAIDLKTRVEITKREGSGQVCVHLKDLACRVSWPLSDLIKLSLDDLRFEKIPILEKLVEENLKNGSESEPLDFSAGYLSSAKESLKSFLYIYLQLAHEKGLQKYPELLVDISSDIPIGAGLGSSAAYSVAISAALVKIFHENRNPDPDLINKWAFKSEQVFHGKPSGIDNSVSTYGGTVSFKNGQIEKMNSVKLSKLIIVRTKIQRNTKKLVQITIDRREKFPEIMEKIIGAIGNISDQALISLSKESLEDLETLIEMNQNLLNSLGVGHQKIDEILTIAKNHCLSGKLTGAGGGGCVIVFPRDLEPVAIEDLLTELKNKGLPADLLNVNCSGVILH